jgi:hypothetical protein
MVSTHREIKVETSAGQQAAGWVLWFFSIILLLAGGLYFAGTMAVLLLASEEMVGEDWLGVGITLAVCFGLILMASLMAAFALILRGRVYVAGEYLAKWSAFGCLRDALFFSGVFLLIGGVAGLMMGRVGSGAAALLVGVLGTGGGIVVNRVMHRIVRESQAKREAELKVYQDCVAGNPDVR